jgi:hypothetical protein
MIRIGDLCYISSSFLSPKTYPIGYLERSDQDVGNSGGENQDQYSVQVLPDEPLDI